VFFAVSNMADRDIAIAKRKQPACPPPPARLPTVRSLGTPSLQAGNR
jgi:hypothetical protein